MKYQTAIQTLQPYISLLRTATALDNHAIPAPFKAAAWAAYLDTRYGSSVVSRDVIADLTPPPTRVVMDDRRVKREALPLRQSAVFQHEAQQVAAHMDDQGCVLACSRRRGVHRIDGIEAIVNELKRAGMDWVTPAHVVAAKKLK